MTEGLGEPVALPASAQSYCSAQRSSAAARMRNCWRGPVAVIALSLVTATTFALPTFTITPIPLPGPFQPGQTALVPRAINNNGQVTGTLFAPGSAEGYDAFLYSAGVVTDLGTLTDPKLGVGGATGEAINDAGVIVGTIVDGVNESWSYGFMYTSGRMTPLAMGAGLCTALDINDNGVMIGACGGTVPDVAVIYANGAMEQIGSGSATAVNQYGQIVGLTDGVNAAIYQFGTTTDIPALSGQAVKSTVATSINNAGQVVGFASFSNGITPWYYRNGTTQALQLPGGCPMPVISTCPEAPGLSLNNAGQIVGYNAAFSAQANQSVVTPFFIQDGVASDLNTSIDPTDPNAPFVTIIRANAINDNGWIVATGLDSRTQVYSGYILVPTTPFPPMVQLGAVSTATAGTAFTLAWTNQSVTSCAASGGSGKDGWGGAVSTHAGQQQVTETAAGNYTFTLTCKSSSAAVSSSTTVIVPVVDPGGGSGGSDGGTNMNGGGGGGLDSLTLATLLILGGLQFSARSGRTRTQRVV